MTDDRRAHRGLGGPRGRRREDLGPTASVWASPGVTGRHAGGGRRQGWRQHRRVDLGSGAGDADTRTERPPDERIGRFALSPDRPPAESTPVPTAGVGSNGKRANTIHAARGGGIFIRGNFRTFQRVHCGASISLMSPPKKYVGLFSRGSRWPPLRRPAGLPGGCGRRN